MNQGRVWCVVSPTVGLPLLIGSVAVTSLIVHACVLSHVSWFGAYWEGAAKPAATSMATGANGKLASATTVPGYSVTVTPTGGAAANPVSFTITVAPPAAHARADAVPIRLAPRLLPPPIQSASAN